MTDGIAAGEGAVFICVVEIPKGHRNKYEYDASSVGSSSIDFS